MTTYTRGPWTTADQRAESGLLYRGPCVDGGMRRSASLTRRLYSVVVYRDVCLSVYVCVCAWKFDAA